ncbi:Polyadenylation and cleavage factor homolog 4-like protein [Drosera capensis]
MILLSHHQNPRNPQLGFHKSPNHSPKSSPSPSNDAVMKQLTAAAAASTPILDRFRDLVATDRRRRGGGGGGDVVVRAYEVLLSELTSNSKPIITELTIIAGEQRQHAKGIAEAICSRILEVPDDQKMPALYLLDSIVKNIGQEYVQYFSSRLFEVFCEAYKQMQPHLHPAMHHLFRTWSTVFSSVVLSDIRARLHFSSVYRQSAGSANARTLESPRPSHGIHVNPKYLEAKRQYDSSTVNTNVSQERGVSTSKILGKRSASGYDGYDSDQVAAERLTEYGGRTSFGVSRSPRRIAERLTPSHEVDCGLGKFTGKDLEAGNWAGRHGLENPPAYGPSNGYLRDRPRALIDAYGQDDGQRASSGKSPRTDLVNGMSTTLVSRPWQNSEEEEFDWEDMSPTLVASRKNDPTAYSGSSSSLDISGGTALDPNFRSTNGPTPVPRSNFNHSVISPEDTVSDGHAPVTSRARTQEAQFINSLRLQETWKRFPDPLLNSLPNGRVEGNSQLNSAMARSSAYTGNKAALNMDHLSRPDSQFGRLPTSEKVRLAGFDSINSGTPPLLPPSTGLRHPTSLHASHQPPYPPSYASQKQVRGQFDFVDTCDRFVNQPLPQQQFNGDEVRNPMPVRSHHLPYSQAVSTPLHQPTQPPAPFQLQMLPVSQAQQTSFSSSFAPSPMMPMTRGYVPGGYGPAPTSTSMNPLRGQRPPMSLHNPGAMLPSPFPGPYHASSQSLPPVSSVSIPQQTSGGLSGLFSSLVAQGVLSLTKQAPGQESLDVEFDQELLRIRHESAVQALYGDLPRQCRTCGLRFKTQEEHSKHMDWHVTKNRLSRNRKQNPSRKWFVSVNMWLTGAEALGAESAPGFLPTETVEEKKDDDKMAVPADEDQSTCALCGESFEDFYSDETEEWMYKGAVYLNASGGSVAGLDRSLLGPIVHAKCRSEFSAVLPKDTRQEEVGTSEEGSQRKWMRT